MSDKRFTTNECSQDQLDAMQGVRDMAEDFTEQLELLPPSRERSLAATKIEEAMFWANAAISRNGLNA
jgi:hypothetical protein